MRAVACASALVAVLAVAACGGDSDSDSGGSGDSASDLNGKQVVVLEKFGDPAFWPAAINGVKSVGKKYDWKVSVQNSNGDAATQAENVTNVTSGSFDGAVIGPVATDGAAADLNRLKNAGIDTVCLDSCATEEQSPDLAVGFTTTKGSDLGDAVGAATVDYIEKELDGKANIAMVVCDSLGPVCSDRHDAIDKQLEAVPSTKVVATQDAFETAKAVPKVVTMLTAHPETNVIVANNVGGAEGAIAAVKQLDLADKVAVFGVDISPVLGKALLASPAILQYTVAQDSFKEGQIAAQMLIDTWSGKKVDPFTVYVPVAEFPRSDTAKVDAYLEDPLGKPF